MLHFWRSLLKKVRRKPELDMRVNSLPGSVVYRVCSILLYEGNTSKIIMDNSEDIFITADNTNFSELKFIMMDNLCLAAVPSIHFQNNSYSKFNKNPVAEYVYQVMEEIDSNEIYKGIFIHESDFSIKGLLYHLRHYIFPEFNKEILSTFDDGNIFLIVQCPDCNQLFARMTCKYFPWISHGVGPVNNNNICCKNIWEK